jgi:hypothetical protein
MPRLRLREEPSMQDGHIDLSFRDPAGWDDLPYPNVADARACVMLLGDADAGPLVVLAWFPPMDDALVRGWAHGHDSDNWRITLLGESHMGPAAYRPGEFRFQNGGKPYGGDDYAAGPDGGYHLVMFGDRRGFPMRPVKAEHADKAARMATRTATALDISVVDPYPVAEQGVRTSLGVPDKAGKVDGSFADADAWEELVPGVRAACGLIGTSAVGPVLVLLRCEPGTAAVPRAAFGSELLVMVVDGSCAIGHATLEVGDVRIQAADAETAAVVAGAAGLSVVLLIADRRGRTPRTLDESPTTRSWSDALTTLIDAC